MPVISINLPGDPPIFKVEKISESHVHIVMLDFVGDHKGESKAVPIDSFLKLYYPKKM